MTSTQVYIVQVAGVELSRSANYSEALALCDAQQASGKAAGISTTFAPNATPEPAAHAEIKSQRRNPYADLPQVVAIDRIEDSGEYGNASCPHCGAQGRYVVHFRCADGSQRGAMKGCFSHFPQHPFAKEHMRILGKQKEYAEKGWNLPTWDHTILAAIEAFADGEIPEWDASDRISQAKQRAAAYRNRRNGKRS